MIVIDEIDRVDATHEVNGGRELPKDVIEEGTQRGSTAHVLRHLDIVDEEFDQGADVARIDEHGVTTDELTDRVARLESIDAARKVCTSTPPMSPPRGHDGSQASRPNTRAKPSRRAKSHGYGPPFDSEPLPSRSRSPT